MTGKRKKTLDGLCLVGNSGVIRCEECHDARWCKHIEAAILGGDDQEMFWHGGITDFFYAQVPMIPTQNQFADCKISRTDSTQPHRLHLAHSDDSTPINLGITGPGEGLKVWRSMIWDYFCSQVTENQKCQNRSHSFQAQNKLAADLRQKPTEAAPRAQVWSIWYNKMCVMCHESKTYMLNTNEFVPDDGSSKLSWSNLQMKGKSYGPSN